MNTTDDVPYGFTTVTAGEKRRLVDAHFDAIARRYDLADTLLSFGLDQRWRVSAVRRLSLKRGDTVLDLCGGTAGLALLAAREVSPGGSVTVCDISLAMMRSGRRRARRTLSPGTIEWVQGDAENLGFVDGAFDSVTIGFGVRNFVHLDRGLAEIHRVLKRGGRLMILEFSVPRSRWFRGLYDFYSFRVMPGAARLITGTSAPFAYLAESIRVFPPPEKVASSLEGAGFTQISIQKLTKGIVTVYTAQKEL